MSAEVYEISATVDEPGQVHVAGVPFQPGTRVEVTIKPADNGAESPAGAAARVARLYAALDKARNTETIKPLRCPELDDRDQR